jgi:hypothetical protein
VYLFYVFESALKIFFIGKNADCIGAAFLVGLRNCHRVEIFANNPSRRRGLFDLCDNIYAATAGPGDGFVEVAALGLGADLFLKLLETPL